MGTFMAVDESTLSNFGFWTNVGYLCFNRYSSGTPDEIHWLENRDCVCKLLSGGELDYYGTINHPYLLLNLHEGEIVQKKIYGKLPIDPHALRITRSQFMTWIKGNAVRTQDGRSLKDNVIGMLEDMRSYVMSRGKRPVRGNWDYSIYLDVEEWWNKCSSRR